MGLFLVLRSNGLDFGWVGESAVIVMEKGDEVRSSFTDRRRIRDKECISIDFLL